jgi:hypothetical protein
MTSPSTITLRVAEMHAVTAQPPHEVMGAFAREQAELAASAPAGIAPAGIAPAGVVWPTRPIWPDARSGPARPRGTRPDEPAGHSPAATRVSCPRAAAGPRVVTALAGSIRPGRSTG